MRRAVVALALLIIGGMAYIRLAPDDPAHWNTAIGAQQPGIGWTVAAPDTNFVTAGDGDAHGLRFDTKVEPRVLLARLDAIALATPRTRRLAGSAVEGRITWVTRTFFFGYPDYTTAEALGAGPATRLDLYARLRYGRRDFGVNEARLRDWLALLAAQ